MYIFIEILLSIFFASIPFIIYKKSNKKDLSHTIISSVIIFIGCMIRLLAIESYPIGLNQDEASIGYESYSILNYGIDRNGMSFPVHFISWGSGQNTLYGYLIIPFIKIFGVNNFSIRIPMALIGCVTLLVFYFLFKKEYKEKKDLIFLLIFAITPWHILKSRWGLESNIFPDLVFYSLVLIYYGIVSNNKKCFIISSIILGISTYSYGTSYLFIPIFSLLIYIYLCL